MATLHEKALDLIDRIQKGRMPAHFELIAVLKEFMEGDDVSDTDVTENVPDDSEDDLGEPESGSTDGESVGSEEE